MSNELQTAFNEIAELRSLPLETVLDALQHAMVTAYRRDAGASSAQRVEAQIDPNTGRVRIFVEKEVVDDVFNDATEVLLEKARFYDPDCQLGDTVMVQVEGSTKRLGRIAAQSAKQVILQRIREAERKSLYEEYADREGDLITGTVQSVTHSVVTLSLGRAEAILPRAQQIPGERYRPHDKTRTYVLEVKNTNRGPQIVVSRAHRNMLRRLLEYEVPEIFNGQVEIKNIAREAGYRSKVAVAALQEGIDPVGACVGMRGVRIQNIVKELHDEKIDVIEWSSDHEVFIAKALSPARVTGVYLDDDPDSGRTAIVLVPDDQLSLAIGREGQNARLAAKLTGWRIDIKSVTESVQWALDNHTVPEVAAVLQKMPDIFEEAQRIMGKKQENRTIMPEEYTNLARFAGLVESSLQGKREEARKRRREEINAVKTTLPEHAFNIPVDTLELPAEIKEALLPLGNAGEVMLRFLIDEDRVRRMLEPVSEDALTLVQEALDQIVFPDMEEPAEEAEEVEDAPAAEPVETVEAVEAAAEADEPQEDVVLDAFGGQVTTPEPEVIFEPEAVPAPAAAPEAFVADDFEFDEEDEGAAGDKGKQKKSRQKRRQLFFDEKTGEMVAKRRRKRGSKGWEPGWDES